VCPPDRDGRVKPGHDGGEVMTEVRSCAGTNGGWGSAPLRAALVVVRSPPEAERVEGAATHSAV